MVFIYSLIVLTYIKSAMYSCDMGGNGVGDMKSHGCANSNILVL